MFDRKSLENLPESKAKQNKMKNRKNNLRKLEGQSRRSNIWKIGYSERENRKKGEEIFKRVIKVQQVLNTKEDNETPQDTSL